MKDNPVTENPSKNIHPYDVKYMALQCQFGNSLVIINGVLGNGGWI